MEQTFTPTDPSLPTATNATQVAEFLQEHSEVEMILPVILGLFVTSRLQLRGTNALLVNLAVASISRQIFRELKKQPSESLKSPQTKTSSTPQDFLGEGCKIVHSVPGRIRLRIDKIGQDSNFAKRLERLLQEEDCVLKVRMNSMANSVVIYYEVGQLTDFELGMRLLNILHRADQEFSSHATNS